MLVYGRERQIETQMDKERVHEGMEKEMENTTSLGVKFNVAAQKGLLGVSRQQGNIIPL